MKNLFTLLTMLLLMSVTAKAQIVEKPAGEEKLYVRTGSAFVPEEGNTDLKTHTQTGKAARMVYDSDGTTVYISCPVSMFPDPVWVKGTLSDDKSTVSVALGQVLRHDAKHNTDLVLAVLNSKEVTSGGDTYLEYSRRFRHHSGIFCAGKHHKPLGQQSGPSSWCGICRQWTVDGLWRFQHRLYSH